ncbi:MAG: hypothetical protein ACXWEI_17625 [Mycobacterium sp.]
MSGFVDWARGRAEAVTKRAEVMFAEARDREGLVDFVADLYDRDTESRGSVLGSAIALRLFLFVIPATVTLVGLVNVLGLDSLVRDDLSASVTTGPISTALSGVSWPRSLWIFASGSVLTLLAGRSLAKVLAACAAGAWKMTARESTMKPIAVAALTGVLVAHIASSSVFNRLRDADSLPLSLTAWLAVMATTAVTWFLLMLVLPRKVSDPGALLPGAALMGVCFTVLQWFMQFYLPNRIERTTDTFGELAVTVATLGNFFFIGRLMASTFVTTAVVYERWGSLSQLVFELPGLRRVAGRSPQLRRYFSLAPLNAEEDVTRPAKPSDQDAGSVR